MTIAILIHALLFLAFWLTNLPFQETLNNFLVNTTGQLETCSMLEKLTSGSRAW